jgi:FkbM family methyltransferase
MDRRARFLHLLEKIPALRSERVRRWLRSTRQRIRRHRRLLLEARGDDRLSRPALQEMEQKLHQYLPKRGFFVEAGAHDGFTQSNTYYLERFLGWTGLLVEPVPEFYREAVTERPASRVVNCALVSPERAGQLIRVHHAGPMSIVAGARGDATADRAYLDLAAALPMPTEQYEVDVPGRTLSELLGEMHAPEVDFLSLDVEGYEAEVLAGLDLQRHAPRHILVEAQNDAAVARIEGQLQGSYRFVERLTPTDLLYERVS